MTVKHNLLNRIVEVEESLDISSHLQLCYAILLVLVHNGIFHMSWHMWRILSVCSSLCTNGSSFLFWVGNCSISKDEVWWHFYYQSISSCDNISV